MYGGVHEEKVKDLLKDKPLPGNNKLHEQFNKFEPSHEKVTMIQKAFRGYQGRKLVLDKKRKLQTLKDGDYIDDVEESM